VYRGAPNYYPSLSTMACICECLPSIGQIIFTLVTFYLLKFAYNIYKVQKSGSKTHTPKIQKEDWKKDVVYLYQFPRPEFLPQLSPFCLKIEAFLRLHDIKHEVISTFSGRSKKGLLPFIEFNGEHIADSQFIVFHLRNHFNIQDDLTEEQKAVERSFDRMIEGSLFYSGNWLKVKDDVVELAGVILSLRFGKSADFLKHLAGPILKMMAYKRFKIEGTANHSDEEVLTILRHDLQAIEGYLGDKEFFFGDKPSLVDIMIFAHIAGIYYIPYHHKAKDLIQSEFPKILKQVKKIEKRLFSEFKFGQ